MSVNESSILNKLDEYFKSKECEEKIQSTISMYLKKGVSTTNAGSKVIDEKWILNIADMLKDNIIRFAKSASLPASVMDDVNSLQCCSPVKEGDKIRVDLVFTNNLHRTSLYPEKYNGEDELENIIALYNTGIKDESMMRAYGWWDNHEYDESKDPTGEVLWRSGGVKSSVYIGGMTHLEEKRFMQNAVDDFLKSVGSDVDITVELAPIYYGIRNAN